jgi:hypothetical protein
VLLRQTMDCCLSSCVLSGCHVGVHTYTCIPEFQYDQSLPLLLLSLLLHCGWI